MLAPLICLDPGHGTPPAIGRQVEPIGPGSRALKIKDGGGATGEPAIALAIARRTRTDLLRRGFRVAMTRTSPTFRLGNGGNIARARFCNRRHAALMLRIHADGASNPALHGVATLYPAYHPAWTDDIFTRSVRAARLVQRSVVAATGAGDGARRALGPDRVQLGERARDPGRDGLPHERGRTAPAPLQGVPGARRPWLDLGGGRSPTVMRDEMGCPGRVPGESSSPPGQLCRALLGGATWASGEMGVYLCWPAGSKAGSPDVV